MVSNSSIKAGHRIGAFLLGYLAAGATYTIFPILITYPIGRSGLLDLEDGKAMIDRLSTLAAILAWVLIYRYAIRNWWPGKAAIENASPNSRSVASEKIRVAKTAEVPVHDVLDSNDR